MTNMPMDSGAASLGAAAAFLGMWVVMTAAMMLPSLAPTLRYCRRALRAAGEVRTTHLTVVIAAGYFFTWSVVGVVAYPLSVVLAQATPLTVAAIVITAGIVQLTAWKARQLARYRETAALARSLPTTTHAAWRHGLRLGWHCTLSCAAPMAGLLVIGMMDLRAMGVVTIAITLERLVPAGTHASTPTGTVTH
jgi:predicted metal-binding membrane protein